MRSLLLSISNRMRPRWRHPRFATLLVASAICVSQLSGCDQLTPEEMRNLVNKVRERQQAGENPFETTDPAGLAQGGGSDAHWPGAGPKQPVPDGQLGEGAGKNPENGDAAGIIAEADLVQVIGDRLYALSEFRGLSVIDIQNPDSLKLLGEYPIDATPFEMYVFNGQAYLMVRDLLVNSDAPKNGSKPANFGYYQRSSAFIVLDLRNPAQIRELASWSVPGQVLDSRRIGTNIYLMSHENGGCWACDSEPKVRIHAFALQRQSSPDLVSTVDLKIPERSWGRAPSLVANDRRLYVALPDKASTEGALSSIRAVDISDPRNIRELSTIAVAGEIQSRWQMNEHQGVLRVVSQPGASLEAPTVETFSMKDPQAPQALGQLEMKLPRPESLRAVRFDGDRAFAITFERTDPLFTLDLRDPKKPEQLGELEIPGWVHHMEPRGDRLLGIGFDRTNKEGSLNASLFDLSDLRKPSMIKRVHFGGQQGRFPEGQNQIHKALRIWDEQGLITVPFQAWERRKEIISTPDGDRIDCERRQSRDGIVLIDWKDDDLKLRGEIATQGAAKRSLLHKNRLLALSSQAVASYDLSDRDKPELRSELRTQVIAEQLLSLNDGNLLRAHRDDDSRSIILDIVSPEQANEATPLGRVTYKLPPGQSCFDRASLSKIFTVSGFVYLQIHEYRRNKRSSSLNRSLVAFDFSNPQKPRYHSTTLLDEGPSHYLDQGVDNIQIGGDSTLVSGDYFYVARANKRDWQTRRVDSELEVYRLDSGELRKIKSIHRPQSRYAGGLHELAPGKVSSWYAVPSKEKGSDKITFHWQNLAASPDENITVQDITVPGLPLIQSPAGSGRLSLGFRIGVQEGLEAQECYQRPNYRRYDRKSKRCYTVDHSLQQLVIVNDQAALLAEQPLVTDQRSSASNLALSQGRMAFHSMQRSRFPGPWPVPGMPEPAVLELDEPVRSNPSDALEAKPGRSFEPLPPQNQETHIAFVGDSGKLYRSTLEQDQPSWGAGLTWLSSTKLLRSAQGEEFEIFDLQEIKPSSKLRYRRPSTRWYCNRKLLTGQDILCSAGPFGVRRLSPLP